MPKLDRADPPIASDHHFVIRDDRGGRHDLGTLVTTVVDLHRHHPVSLETPADLPIDRRVVTATAEAGLEMGITLAVRTLFGDAAAAAFRAHCAQIERLLDDTEDMARH